MSGKIRFFVAAFLLGLLAVLWFLRPTLQERFAVQGPKLVTLLLEDFESALLPEQFTKDNRQVVRFGIEDGSVVPSDLRPKLEAAARKRAENGDARIRLAAGDEPGRALTLAWNGTAQDVELRVEDGTTQRRELTSYLSLLPPFLTILIAVLVGKTIPALLAGVLLGSWFLSGTGMFVQFGKHYVYERVLTDDFRLEILGFVAFLMVTIGVLTRAGGIEGLVDIIKRFARSARSSQFVAYLMGFVVFFDDYANTIVVGSTMRPLTDRMRVSREKLAYIVDSTAAPIAGISVLSTWVAYEISTFSAQLPDVGMKDSDGFEVFLATLPYRFYCIFTLFFVAATILMRREFGPMLAAERRASTTGRVLREGAVPLVSEEMTTSGAKEGAPPRWYNGFLPIAILIVVTLYFLWDTGKGKRSFAFDFALWRDVLGDAVSSRAILYGSMAAAGSAILLALGQRILSPIEVALASWKALRGLGFAMIILVLAWCIGYVCEDLGTAYFLVAQTQGSLPPLLLPVLLFLLSCLVAFATGSSWSTMSILLPIVVILAHSLGADLPIGGQMLMVLSIGAVLEGSIFGDHCSPISDTTVLSSVASASDHLDHVQTQIPYAITAMIVSIVCGYLPVAFLSPELWPVCLIAGAVVLVMFLIVAGRNPDHATVKE
ncbi:MAG: Na+/H+ antiporter NhaC family protein [Planctomycetes bacterium]|nr:Na+/H+ antiporter NhaC family protein [Planctomycetota bacterium]MCB9891689.1 Na+/H+ antiporter NhaC family protein [Planctomycetota bacterium]